MDQETTKYLNEKFPEGYLIIVPGKPLFGMFKVNPKGFAILEVVEKFVLKISAWSHGGNLN